MFMLNCEMGKGIGMTGENIQHLISIVAYMAVVIVIGIVFAKRANKDTEAYFLGGRTLGPGFRRSARKLPICPAGF